MSETNDLASLLDGAAPSQPAQPEPVRQEAPSESTASTETGEKQDAAPPAASDEGEPSSGVIPIKALHEERRKRQDLERQLAELTKQRTAPPPQTAHQGQHQNQPPQAQPQMPERPDPWIDPQGAMDWDRAMMTQQMQREIYQTRTVMSRELMLAKPDFEEVESIFFNALPSNPQLAQQLFQHPMPAKFAYEMGLKIRALSEIGEDPEAYRQRVREEIRAELQGQSVQPAPTQTPKASAPKSLAATPSAQPRDDRGRFQGPASLESILGG